MKVCHVSTVHLSSDIRIYQKECKTLSDFFDVSLAIANVDSSQENSKVKIKKIKNRNGKFGRILFSFWDTRKVVKEINAEIYHLHDPELVILGIYLKLIGKKVIYDSHEDMPRAILSKYWIPVRLRKVISIIAEKVEDYCAKRFDLVIGATPLIKNRFAKVNHNSIAINNFPFINELSSGNNSMPFVKRDKQVCYIGGITKIRGIEQIIEASSHINDFKIVLAGPFDDIELQKKIKTIKNIEYKGILNRSDVRTLFDNSLAGIVTFLPEPNHIYSQPNKMFEYMSAGLPIICSDFPLWREMINKYNCGICVNPNNPEEIAKAINYLIEHPEKAQEMGKNGRMAIEENYNWESEKKKLIDAYRQLIKD